MEAIENAFGSNPGYYLEGSKAWPTRCVATRLKKAIQKNRNRKPEKRLAAKGEYGKTGKYKKNSNNVSSCFLSKMTEEWIVQEKEKDSIGSIKMLEDNSVVLHLRAESENGVIGDAMFTYKPEESDYSKIIKHVGGLGVGEEKQVPPWE